MSQISAVLDKVRTGAPVPTSDEGSASRPYHHGDLSRALVLAGRRILESQGIAALSLRAVAREAGVSPAAPYHHFKDKGELLDAVAEEHVRKMHAAGRIAHDSGDGNLVARLEDDGIVARLVGENVARAQTVALAHRALHASPSHRSNLLNPRFREAGFAAVESDGLVWVCEVFLGR